MAYAVNSRPYCAGPQVQRVQHEGAEHGLCQQVVDGHRADQRAQQRAPKEKPQPLDDLRAQ